VCYIEPNEIRADLEAANVGAEPIRRNVRKPRTKRKHAVRLSLRIAVERLRAAFVERGRAADAALISVLAYAGVRPEEALALEWRHVHERTLLVAQEVDGEPWREHEYRNGAGGNSRSSLRAAA
jgi:integrase